MDTDAEVMTMLDQSAMSYIVTLTKMDQLRAGERDAAIAASDDIARKHVAAYPEIFATSAHEREGLEPVKTNLMLVAEA